MGPRTHAGLSQELVPVAQHGPAAEAAADHANGEDQRSAGHRQSSHQLAQRPGSAGIVYCECSKLLLVAACFRARAGVRPSPHLGLSTPHLSHWSEQRSCALPKQSSPPATSQALVSSAQSLMHVD